MPRLGAKTLRLVLLVAGAMLLVAEAAFRLIGPLLPPEIPSPADIKRAQMESIRRAGGVDVVFAGSSMVFLGIDPQAFQEETGFRAYNAGLHGSTLQVTEAWLRDEVLPRLTPRFVILGISSPDLNANFESPNAHLLLQECCPESGVAGGAEAWVARYSYLFRYRSRLNSHRAIGRLLDAAQGVEAQGTEVDALGAGSIQRSGYELREDHVKGLKEHVLQNFSITNASVERLQDVVEATSSTGADVLLLKMPVTDDFIDLHPEPRDYGSFETLFEDLGSRFQIPAVDVSNGFRSRHRLFHDSNHLNTSGRREFTRRFSEWFNDYMSSDGIVFHTDHTCGANYRPRKSLENQTTISGRSWDASSYDGRSNSDLLPCGASTLGK